MTQALGVAAHLGLSCKSVSSAGCMRAWILGGGLDSVVYALIDDILDLDCKMFIRGIRFILMVVVVEMELN
jgi:hypothetical protein